MNTRPWSSFVSSHQPRASCKSVTQLYCENNVVLSILAQSPKHSAWGGLRGAEREYVNDPLNCCDEPGAFDGRNTAMSALPSPSKSAGEGISSAMPKLTDEKLPSEEFKIYQVPDDGR